MCRALGSSRTREKEPCHRVLSLPCGFHTNAGSEPPGGSTIMHAATGWGRYRKTVRSPSVNPWLFTNRHVNLKSSPDVECEVWGRLPHLGKNGPMDHCPVSERLVWRQRPLKLSEQLWIKQTDH